MASDSLERYLDAHPGLPNPCVLASGDVVDGWRIVALIGRGGSSEVYRVERTDGGFVAALKLLKVGTESDPRHRVRFAREVKLLAETSSPCFPRLFASGEMTSGAPYLVEELLEPRNLPRTDRAVAKYVFSVCRGVGELHRRGIVHRDLKPANILYRADGAAVVSDLGLAKESVSLADRDGTSIVDGLPVGVGTPGYSAPEQFINGEASAASDIHAIGVLIDACFNGAVPRAWRGIVRRATSSLPAQRYETVGALARAVVMRHWKGRTAVAVVIALLLGLAWMRSEDSGGEGAGSPTGIAGLATEGVFAAVVSAADNPAGTRPVTKESVVEASPHAMPLRNEVRAAEKQLIPNSSEEQDRPEKSVVGVEALKRGEADSGWPRVMRLNGGCKILKERLVLEDGGIYRIVGPGMLDADISGADGTTLVLKDCVVINRTRAPLTRGLRYRLENGVYLNFIEQRGDNRLRPLCVEPYDGAFNEVRYSGPETLSGLKRQRESESMSLIKGHSSPQDL